MKLHRGFAALLLVAALGTTGVTPSASEAASDHSGNLEYGNPGGKCELLDKQYFVICYDKARRIPLWVSYRLRKSDLTGNQKRTNKFYADATLDKDAQSLPRDYARSGFDQGHMAPANDFTRSLLAMSATFVLSNMTPQRGSLNRGKWKTLEGEVHDLASDAGTVWVVTGSLFLDEKPRGYVPTVPDKRVAVPTHLYKAILARDSGGEFSMYAFVLPNANSPIRKTIPELEISVKALEGLTGLDFFSGLEQPLQKNLESVVGDWPYR